MISFAEAGDPVLLILSVPAEFAATGSDTDCFAIPVLSRQGGFLLCVPRGVLSEDALIDCLSGEDASHVLGPSKGIAVQLHEEGEEQAVVPVPGTFNVMLVDFSDDALLWVREYDQNSDSLDSIVSFAQEHPFGVSVASHAVGSLCSGVDCWTRIRKGKFLFGSRRAGSSSGKEGICKRCGKTQRCGSEESHKRPDVGADGDNDGPDEVLGGSRRSFGAVEGR